MKTTINTEQTPPLSIEEAKWQRVQLALRVAGGNRAKAARLLGIDPVTLWRWMKGRTA